MNDFEIHLFTLRTTNELILLKLLKRVNTFTDAHWLCKLFEKDDGVYCLILLKNHILSFSSCPSEATEDVCFLEDKISTFYPSK